MGFFVMLWGTEFLLSYGIIVVFFVQGMIYLFIPPKQREFFQIQACDN